MKQERACVGFFLALYFKSKLQIIRNVHKIVWKGQISYELTLSVRILRLVQFTFFFFFFSRTVFMQFSWNPILRKNSELFLSRPSSQTRIKPFNLGLLNNKGWRHLKKQTRWMRVRWIWSFLKTLIWSSLPELIERVPHWRTMLIKCIMCLCSSPHTTSTPSPACGWNRSPTTAADCEFVSENVIYWPKHQDATFVQGKVMSPLNHSSHHTRHPMMQAPAVIFNKLIVKYLQ